MTLHIFYHADCIDGFTAAWCFWKKYGSAAALVPLQYQDWEKTRALIDLRPEDEVVFVDVTIPPKDAEALTREVAKVIVLDHHKTAMEAWEQHDVNPYELVRFDLDKSGARLAWEHCFPEREAPLLVQYVEDRDLWRFKLPHSKIVHAYVAAHPLTFPAFDGIAEDLESAVSSVIDAGDAILMYKQRIIESVTKNARPFALPANDILYTADAVNYGSVHCVSEIGYVLAQRTGIGLVWSVEGDQVRVSLRGNDRIDVSAIAKYYGGGGHPNAAGFKVPIGAWVVLLLR